MPILTVAFLGLHSCCQISLNMGLCFESNRLVFPFAFSVLILNIVRQNGNDFRSLGFRITCSSTLPYNNSRTPVGHRHVASFQREGPVYHALPAAAAGSQSILHYRTRTKLLVADTILAFLIVPVA
jgi:hypothetical protein